MSRRLLIAAAAVVASGIAVLPAASRATSTLVPHKLVVVVEKKTVPAVLVLIRRGAGAPAAAVATPSKPLTVLLDTRGPYVVRAEIDSSCKGSCAASVRISGAENHKLEIVARCRRKGSTLVCTTMKIVKTS